MEVLEHSENRLVIQDGSVSYSPSAVWLTKRIKEKGYRRAIAEQLFTASLMGAFVTLVLLLFGVRFASLKEALVSFLLCSLFFAFMSVDFYIFDPRKKGALVIFDKNRGKFIVNHSIVCDLKEVASIQLKTTEDHWVEAHYSKKIHIILRSGKVIKLYSLYDEPDKQWEIMNLIREFLGLSRYPEHWNTRAV